MMNEFILIMSLSVSFNLLMLAYILHIENQCYDIVYELVRARGVIWKSKEFGIMP